MSQGGAASTPAAQPQAQDEAVLGEVLVQQRTLRQGPVEEDPDLALAKLLQAQEQAWLAMAGQGSGILENLPPAAGGGEAGAGPHEGGGGEEGGEVEELTDEEMARRLQEQEEREFQQRLLELAGMGQPGAAPGGGGGIEAPGGDEYLPEDDVDPDEMTYEELSALGEAVGTVSKGISQAQIDTLPQQAYYEVAGTTAGVEYEPEDNVKVLPVCRHYYHPDCIAEWLKRNKVCCICAKEVIEEGKKTEAAGSGGAASDGVLGERRQQ
ncbi:hypothetical protein CHLNCDRAFT_143853 [Chlorella variabilis]|uniref:Zinc finger RING-H2-type domain-containing protein n=1 Tax=Chlorella variabilis TaxID=554065 RepID=E1ZAL0_CHLVA|nr:hypothetical protein CHLNCDRAFT_143853 [Chlorella variabilis]EFN57277.1 hypothetical protein CHLNCDRAFT_143853 [Chlorella variabilis]|eukprot:XP_005849379.1 hypothetical protein CHLNCDRAFT_143853 [Chlorella variabilis]